MNYEVDDPEALYSVGDIVAICSLTVALIALLGAFGYVCAQAKHESEAITAERHAAPAIPALRRPAPCGH